MVKRLEEDGSLQDLSHIPVSSNEVAPTDDIYTQYFNITKLLLHESDLSMDTITRLTYSDPYIPLRLVQDNETVLTIVRRVSVYPDPLPGISMHDTIVVKDQSLLDSNNKNFHWELNFEASPLGEIVQKPTYTPAEQRQPTSYMQSVVNGFTRAMKAKGSLVVVGGVDKFISDGTKWVPVTPQPLLERSRLPGLPPSPKSGK